jgi:hypothetical protein
MRERHDTEHRVFAFGGRGSGKNISVVVVIAEAEMADCFAVNAGKFVIGKGWCMTANVDGKGRGYGGT